MKRIWKNGFLLLIFSSLFYSAHSQQEENFQKRIFVKTGDTLLYRILYPVNFDPGKKYPMVLFLHGAGERGDDNKKQLIHGSKLFLNPRNRHAFPAIVIFPQCPANDYWSNVIITRNKDNTRDFTFQKNGSPTQAMAMLLRFLKKLRRDDQIDKDRMYVGGLSMGGMGTFELLHRRPGIFAAAFAICGGADPSTTANYARKVAVWIFHGEQDEIVSPEFSKRMAAALSSQGGDVRLNLYPEANHNSWDSAFAEEELLPWLFSYHK